MNSSARAAHEWAYWTFGAVAVVALVLYSTLRGYYGVYRLFGDDYALVVHSGKDFVDASRVLSWFTEGYSRYFLNYPDWPSEGFNFLRPVVNAGFYLQSWLAPSLGDSAFLVLGVLVLLGSVVMSCLAMKRYTNLEPWLAAAVGVAVGLAPIWHTALLLPSFATNAFATFFSLTAVVVLDARRRIPSYARTIWCALLLTLAILSHETAVVMTGVCAFLLLGMSPMRPRVAQVAVLLLPAAILLYSRAMLGDGQVYIVQQMAAQLSGLERLRYAAAGPLFPFYDQMFHGSITRLPMTAVAAFYVGLLVNGSALALFVWCVRRRPRGRAVGLTAALVLASLPALWGAGDPRLGGFAYVVSAVIVFYVSAVAPRARAALIVCLLTAQVLMFSAALANRTGYATDHAVASGEFYDRTSALVAANEPSTIVLVNDLYGEWGSRAMLQMAAWPREDVRLVVLNQLYGDAAHDATLTAEASGNRLRVENLLAPDQGIAFRGNVPDFRQPNQGFTYDFGTIPGGPGSFVAIGTLDRGTTLVLGVDPSDYSKLLHKVVRIEE